MSERRVVEAGGAIMVAIYICAVMVTTMMFIVTSDIKRIADALEAQQIEQPTAESQFIHAEEDDDG